MTLKDAATDLVAAMTGNTIGGQALVTGRNLFAGLLGESQMRNLAVFVLNTGGTPPIPVITPSRSAYFQSAVQVLVYAPGGSPGFILGEALARGVAGFLHQLVPSGYVTVLARDAQPVYLGPDPQDRHKWSTNFEARYVA